MQSAGEEAESMANLGGIETIVAIKERNLGGWIQLRLAQRPDTMKRKKKASEYREVFMLDCRWTNVHTLSSFHQDIAPAQSCDAEQCTTPFFVAQTASRTGNIT